MRILDLVLVSTLVLACRERHEPIARSSNSASATGSSSAASPHEVLDQLDRRRPVPLLPMMAHHQKESMREHLEAVQAVVAAAAVEDFEQVRVAAKRIGFSEGMGRMCEHMGAGAPGFTEQALAFHHTADEIASAAERKNGAAVLSALSRTLSACTSCHAAFKQHVVDRL